MRFRRHIPRRHDWTSWLQRPIRRPGETRRRVIIGLGSMASAFLFGYLFAALALFPAPIFARAQTVPRVMGLPRGEARQQLELVRLTAEEGASISHPTALSGVVVWQDPPPGVEVPIGTTVTLSWSRGPQRVPVPDVSGYEQELATQLIDLAGLVVGGIETTPTPVERGVVVQTRPPAGTTLTPGTGVTLVVSLGAATISVPDLTGLTVEEARRALEQAGLVLGFTPTRTSNAGPPGTVFQQSPAPGTLSAPGAAVNATVVRGRRR